MLLFRRYYGNQVDYINLACKYAIILNSIELNKSVDTLKS